MVRRFLIQCLKLSLPMLAVSLVVGVVLCHLAEDARQSPSAPRAGSVRHGCYDCVRAQARDWERWRLF